MSKSKIETFQSLRIIINLIFWSILILALLGALGSNVLGINIADFIFIITDIYILLNILYSYASIKLNKKNYGNLIFTLKRVKKRRQIILLILLICLFVFQMFLNFIIFNESLSLKSTSMPSVLGLMIIIAALHNIEKEGLADKCIYCWGSPIEWNKVSSYNIKEDILTLYLSWEVSGKIKKANIIFSIENEDKESIENFLLVKSISWCPEVRKN